MGGFSDLGLGVSKVSDHVLQELGPNVVLNFSRVQINDFQSEGAGQ